MFAFLPETGLARAQYVVPFFETCVVDTLENFLEHYLAAFWPILGQGHLGQLEKLRN